MNYNFSPRPFRVLPEVIKNLIVINGLMYVGSFVLKNAFGISLSNYLGLYLPNSENFHPIQLITHMFMHSESSIMHILMNMFMLWMFGSQLENLWGGKRFFIYYILTGFGAALLHWGVNYLEFSYYAKEIPFQYLQEVMYQGHFLLLEGQNYADPSLAKINFILNIPTVGASGAVYGILMAYGMTYPNQIVYLYFAIPIKVKYFILLLIGMELFSGFAMSNSNVANFAHLGGMLFGFLLLRYWRYHRLF